MLAILKNNQYLPRISGLTSGITKKNVVGAIIGGAAGAGIALATKQNIKQGLILGALAGQAILPMVIKSSEENKKPANKVNRVEDTTEEEALEGEPFYVPLQGDLAGKVPEFREKELNEPMSSILAKVSKESDISEFLDSREHLDLDDKLFVQQVNDFIINIGAKRNEVNGLGKAFNKVLNKSIDLTTAHHVLKKDNQETRNFLENAIRSLAKTKKQDVSLQDIKTQLDSTKTKDNAYDNKLAYIVSRMSRGETFEVANQEIAVHIEKGQSLASLDSSNPPYIKTMIDKAIEATSQELATSLAPMMTFKNLTMLMGITQSVNSASALFKSLFNNIAPVMALFAVISSTKSK